MDAQINGQTKAYLAAAAADKKGEFVIDGDDAGNEGGHLRLNGAGSNGYLYMDNFAGAFRVVFQAGGLESDKFVVFSSGAVQVSGRQVINASGYALYG